MNIMLTCLEYNIEKCKELYELLNAKQIYTYSLIVSIIIIIIILQYYPYYIIIQVRGGQEAGGETRVLLFKTIYLRK